jgi:hypothetical protein
VAHRVFKDANGTLWEVWATVPTNPKVVAQGLAAGWLTFQSSTDRRRYGLIPANWDELPDGALERMCMRALPVTKVMSPGFMLSEVTD